MFITQYALLIALSLIVFIPIEIISFVGANPNRRDHGRGLCAEEWAKFTGRENCATAISKYVHSKKYFLKKTFLMTRDKWSSEPDLWKKGRHKEMTKTEKGGAKGWVTRHLSFKRKRNAQQKSDGMSSSLDESSRSTSSPQLTIEVSSPPGSPKAPRRPSCIDGVVPLNMRKFQNKQKKISAISECDDVSEEQEQEPVEPPTILKTDFDEEADKDDQNVTTTTTTTNSNLSRSPIVKDTLGSKTLNRGMRRLKSASSKA